MNQTPLHRAVCHITPVLPGRAGLPDSTYEHLNDILTAAKEGKPLPAAPAAAAAAAPAPSAPPAPAGVEAAAAAPAGEKSAAAPGANPVSGPAALAVEE